MSIFDIYVPRLQRAYCPGYAGVKGNDCADRLTGKAAIKSSMRFGRSEVLGSLRHYDVWTQQNRQRNKTKEEERKKKEKKKKKKKAERKEWQEGAKEGNRTSK